MNIDLDYYKKIAKLIFTTDSPTGYTKNAVHLVENLLQELNINYTLTKKGNIQVVLEGEHNEKTVATSAHLDTLGLMVRSIEANGDLAITNIGGPVLHTLDGEYCHIITRDHQIYTGTILCKASSKHVYSDADKLTRSLDTMICRIDEEIHSKADVIKLGIQNGDFIAYDPKFEITDSGFLKSRFIDDKGSVCVLLTMLKYLKDHQIKPYYRTILYFTVYEEVGHGCSYIDSRIDEFVTVDMGCVGLDLSGNEYDVSICCKDGSGPYDYDLTSKLITLAKKEKISYTTDIFPYYSSDVSAAQRGGQDFKGALIGPGVANSHGMERTHLKSILGTIQLILAYILSE